MLYRNDKYNGDARCPASIAWSLPRLIRWMSPMVTRCPAPSRASRRLPRAATLGVAAAAMAAPLGVVLPAQAEPVGQLPMTPLPTTPLGDLALPATPLPATPIGSTPQPATPLPATPQTNTVTRTVLTPANVRSGPGTNHGIVGGLARGAQVTGKYTSNGWFDMGNNRFVFADLLSGSAPTPPAPPAPSPPPGDTVTRTVTVGANVRSGPGTNHSIVGGLAQGAQVTGKYTSNGWFDMGNSRFVSGSLLSGSAPTPPAPPAPTPPAPPAPAPPPGDTVTRTVSVGSNVRSGPGTNHSIVGSLTAGTQVTGTYTSNGWFDMGNSRFVFGDLLSGGAPPPTPPAPPPTPPAPPPAPAPPPGDTVTRTVSVGANVRSGPGTNYGVVGGLTAGTQVTGRYTNNNWFDMGNSRFVFGDLLSGGSPTPPPPTPPAPPADPAPPGSVTGAAILEEAAKYAGIMYVWGGSTPAGFDCSGYTQYVFGKLGVSLPRTAAQQQAFATTTTSPRPGDLVFFGAPAYHVGIYAGDGMLWDSGRPGLPVQKRAIWNSGDVTYGKVPGTST